MQFQQHGQCYVHRVKHQQYTASVNLGFTFQVEVKPGLVDASDHLQICKDSTWTFLQRRMLATETQKASKVARLHTMHACNNSSTHAIQHGNNNRRSPTSDGCGPEAAADQLRASWYACSDPIFKRVGDVCESPYQAAQQQVQAGNESRHLDVEVLCGVRNIWRLMCVTVAASMCCACYHAYCVLCIPYECSICAKASPGWSQFCCKMLLIIEAMASTTGTKCDRDIPHTVQPLPQLIL